MTPPHHDPAQLYRDGLDLLLAADIDGWLELWAEDGIFEFPFSPPGAPRQLTGKPAIAKYMRAYPTHIDLHEFRHIRIHRTNESETIVAEMRAIGTAVTTQEPYEMDYIAVITVQSGRITHYRDYWNPLALPTSMYP